MNGYLKYKEENTCEVEYDYRPYEEKVKGRAFFLSLDPEIQTDVEKNLWRKIFNMKRTQKELLTYIRERLAEVKKFPEGINRFVALEILKLQCDPGFISLKNKINKLYYIITGKTDEKNYKEKELNILDVAERYSLRLRKSGNKYYTHCPFHEETNASFFIYPKTNSYYCFSCKVSGKANWLNRLLIKGGNNGK